MAMLVAACSPGGGETPAPTTSAQAGSSLVYDFPAEEGRDGFSFRIPVPGWPVKREQDKATYTDPSGKLVLEADRKPIEQEDTLSALQAVAKANSNPGYRLTTLATRADVGGDEAAQWDFTYTRDGAPRQATVVGVGIGDVMITIRYDAPTQDFAANRKVLDDALAAS